MEFKFKKGDVVVVDKHQGEWPAGLTGKICHNYGMAASDVLVEFSEADAKGQGHNGDIGDPSGDPSRSRWHVRASYLTIKSSAVGPIDWFSLNAEFAKQ